MNTPSVNSATAQDRERVISAIVLGFVNDPITRWSWPDSHDYLTYFPAFTNAFGGKAFDHGTAHTVADFLGGALWLPPGVQPDEAALASLMERSIDPKRLQVAASMMEQMQSYHPAEAHWYLPLIGIDPAKQRRGYGSALLRHALERIDQERRAAYLESTNPTNIPLYQRHGFEVLGTIQVDDAPTAFSYAAAASLRAGIRVPSSLCCRENTQTTQYSQNQNPSHKAGEAIGCWFGRQFEAGSFSAD